MTDVRDTSLLSYFELENKGVLEAREAEIYNLLSKKPNLTDNEMVRELKYVDRNELSPARWRLLKQGIIQDNGKRTCNVTKRTVYQWTTNPKIKITTNKKEKEND